MTSTTVWMCMIETNCEGENYWRWEITKYIFPSATKTEAVKNAGEIITQELWVEKYGGVNPDENGIIDLLMLTEKKIENDGKYITYFRDEMHQITNIRVTIWETTM